MQKTFLIIVLFGFIFSSCHTTKTAQRAVRDTSVSSSPATTLNPVDSTGILKQQLSNKINQSINFTTFYGKAKADINSPAYSGNVTIYIKMKKDSAIWISVTALPPLNVEAARILITTDSVKVINKIQNIAQLSSITNLQKITKLPFTFNDFQNIILGQPLLAVNSDYQVKTDSVIVTAASEMLQYFQSFSKSNLLLGQSSFQTSNNTSVTGANIFYNDYHKINNIDFSASRDIAVTGTSPANLELSFKEYNFNEPQSFVFTISKNYTIKYE